MATPRRAPEQRRFTRDEYYRMAEAGLFRDERVELLDGEIVTMSPQNAPHASAVSRVSNLLIPLLGRKYTVRIQLPIFLDDSSEPEPDVAVCELDPAHYQGEHPRPHEILLLIEVADASLEFDRRRKRATYARSGIPELWIVNIPERRVEASRGPDRAARRYRVTRRATPGQTVALPDGTQVDVANLLPRR